MKAFIGCQAVHSTHHVMRRDDSLLLVTVCLLLLAVCAIHDTNKTVGLLVNSVLIVLFKGQDAVGSHPTSDVAVCYLR
jgi:hypothetical protein